MVFAQTAQAPFANLVPIIILFGAFYFIIMRPQQQQQKKRREMLGELKKGDQVVTVGGMYGTITAIQDDVLTLRIAEKVEVKMARSGISRQQQS